MRKELGWIDYSAIIMGIMLGTGIFTVFPTLCAAKVPSLPYILIVWVLGGFCALCGSLCYTELALRIPYNGGDYLYLKEGLSYKGYSPLSFMFGWVQIFVVRPASLISLALVFSANFILFLKGSLALAGLEYDLVESNTVLYPLLTFSVLIIFTFTSAMGIKLNKKMQNVLTLIKVIALILLIIAGLVSGFLDKGISNLSFSMDLDTEQHPFKLIILALIPIMWVYGGWNEASYATGEVKKPGKNIPLALIFGVMTLTALYVLVNFVYVLNLSAAGLAENWSFATDLMNSWFGLYGGILMPLVIAISVVGAINGLIFTGGRMTESFCKDYHLLKYFSHRDEAKETPTASLYFNLFIAVATLIIIMFLLKVDISELTSSIESLLYYTSGVVWFFFALVVCAIFIVRKRTRNIKIDFKVPFSPLTEIVFIVLCCLMIYGAFDFKPSETKAGFIVLLIGFPFYILCKFVTKKHFDK